MSHKSQPNEISITFTVTKIMARVLDAEARKTMSNRSQVLRRLILKHCTFTRKPRDAKD